VQKVIINLEHLLFVLSLQLGLHLLLHTHRMLGIAFPFYQVQKFLLISFEVKVLEYWVHTPFSLRFVEIVHVQLSNETGKVVVFEVNG
jgi:hypothetical protein